MTNAHASFTLTRREAAFNKERQYTGSVLHMKPRFLRFRIENTTNPNDYEAYIVNETSVFEYRGSVKTITEFQLAGPDKLPPIQEINLDKQANNLIYQFFVSGALSFARLNNHAGLLMLGEVTAKDLRNRYTITLFKKDPNYVYLELVPKRAVDQQEFERIRLALYGPDVKAPYTPYAVAQVYFGKPNGDTESWHFKEYTWNAPDIDEKAFQFVPIKGWKIKGPVPPGGLPPEPPAGEAPKP